MENNFYNGHWRPKVVKSFHFHYAIIFPYFQTYPERLLLKLLKELVGFIVHLKLRTWCALPLRSFLPGPKH